ncbi:MAG: excinuclease ABC subunit UvrB [Alphaproteobacteria bacterium]|nr:MAG: excinuclease ABC subunit UvrB [Alphaproteobacteria bacterium]|tara:strand:- start:1365 stop:3353 length:1989 start_codon:yes stop_codon:yes gene_type:complete
MDISKKFKIISDFMPSGDQPEAIKKLSEGLNNNDFNQVLLGVTGSGKTFTMAKTIEELQRPALILAPNKTLAAQLYGEMKTLFPDNAVEYFVSYYDYYQPEAYVARTNTYIEKDASINEQIDRMRHSTTRSLFERKDVIIVASVSCIYGIGPVENYSKMIIDISKNEVCDRTKLIKTLVSLQYKRNDHNFNRGNFRVIGDIIEVFPSHLEDKAWRIDLFGEEIDSITEFDPLTGNKLTEHQQVKIYSNSHYITNRPTLEQAMINIKKDLKFRIKELKNEKKLIEAQRIEERTNFDLEMMEISGTCSGIENYSRYLTGRLPGKAPPTLFEYLPNNTILFVDESHVTIPQINGMYKGDFSRKSNLSEFGFRLPSCVDNRPLKFEEWDKMRPETIFVSATPSNWELEQTHGQFIEQVIRPTGLTDPICKVSPANSQIDDVIHQCKETIKSGFRCLITVLTKKMAENLTEYMNDLGLKVQYMHSDIDTLERIEIIQNLRKGNYDILIGINLLREGLDIPECALVAICDADKEGFLRSHRSLIQTIGRAARNVNGRVILYADNITKSIDTALKETERRRKKQIKWNKNNNIEPKSIIKNISNIIDSDIKEKTTINKNEIIDHKHNINKYIKELKKEMLNSASELKFEKAAEIRDEIKKLENKELGIN